MREISPTFLGFVLPVGQSQGNAELSVTLPKVMRMIHSLVGLPPAAHWVPPMQDMQLGGSRTVERLFLFVRVSQQTKGGGSVRC